MLASPSEGSCCEVDVLSLVVNTVNYGCIISDIPESKLRCAVLVYR